MRWTEARAVRRSPPMATMQDLFTADEIAEEAALEVAAMKKKLAAAPCPNGKFHNAEEAQGMEVATFALVRRQRC